MQHAKTLFISAVCKCNIKYYIQLFKYPSPKKKNVHGFSKNYFLTTEAPHIRCVYCMRCLGFSQYGGLEMTMQAPKFYLILS